MRNRGSRNALIKIDYDLIGQLAGIAGDSAKQYSHRGEYDSRSLDSVLRWINGRRVAKGLPIVGQPDGIVIMDESHSEYDSNVVYTPVSPPPNLSGGYDPLLGGYRTDGITGGTAFRR